MNFLSHFYFERGNSNDYIVMGVLLPDLVKNADKNWNLHPDQHAVLYQDMHEYKSLFIGWNRHIEVDRIFHSSLFFKTQTAILKQMILPAVANSPVKAFFLAHIGLELILDHLLLQHQLVDIHGLYNQLQSAHTEALEGFLKLAGLPDQQQFNRFLDQYISSRYLFNYDKIESITYSLNRICMRLWTDPFTEEQLKMLSIGLESYKKLVENHYLSIFGEIEYELNK